MLHAKSWKLEAWCWKLETRSWKLEAGNWKLETGNWKLDAGSWKLETGIWKLETRSLKLEAGNENLEAGKEKLEAGSWKGESWSWKREAWSWKLERRSWKLDADSLGNWFASGFSLSSLRLLLRQGAVHQKRRRRGQRGAAAVQEERAADGEGHGAGQHVGGRHAVHRAPRPGAGQRHAAAAVPLLPVSRAALLQRLPVTDADVGHEFKLHFLFGQVVSEELPGQRRMLAGRNGTVWTRHR